MSLVKIAGKCIAQSKLQRSVKDERYTIALEYYGYPEARYVVRWCDKWLGQSANLNDAIFIAICHQDERGLKLL